MIKLVASDLDGTLLQGGAQSLSPRSEDLIRRLTEKGSILWQPVGANMIMNEEFLLRFTMTFLILPKTALSEIGKAHV